MKIRICEANRDLIAKALAGAQYGCSNRTITPEEVINCAMNIDKELDIPKADKVGTSVEVDLYAGIDTWREIAIIPAKERRSTQVTLTYYKSGWYLTDVKRRVPRSHQYTVDLSYGAKWAILYYKYKFWDNV